MENPAPRASPDDSKLPEGWLESVVNSCTRGTKGTSKNYRTIKLTSVELTLSDRIVGQLERNKLPTRVETKTAEHLKYKQFPRRRKIGAFWKGAEYIEFGQALIEIEHSI